MRPLRIATRKSPLALWQARHVAQRLQALEPALPVELVELLTAGDRFLRAPLAEVGGKGLFVKEIEQALLEGRADVAVHSLKDLTSSMPGRLTLAAVPEREDPRDAWVSPQGLALEALPLGATVGTSSLRRACQLLSWRADLRIVPLRGNVQRRLEKTREQKLSGTVLALAGLRRLGLAGQVTQVLSAEQSLPAVGQGALALQCRGDDADTLSLLTQLDHPATRAAVEAERGFLQRLEGGCTVPLAAHAVFEGRSVRTGDAVEGGHFDSASLRSVRAGELFLRALIGAPDGSRLVPGESRGDAAQARALGAALAETLLDRGGRELLALAGSDPSR